MENKCFACEVLVLKLQTHENAETYEYVKELITYCVPEVENTNFDFPVNVCLRCIELLEGYTKFKRKCLDWQEQFQHLLQDHSNLCDGDEKTGTNEETDEEETIIMELVADDDPAEPKAAVVAQGRPIGYNSPDCKGIPKTKKLLIPHIHLGHTNKKKIQCPICNEEFKHKMFLHTHMRTHDHLRSHICQFCGKGFKTNGAMEAHEARHGDGCDYWCQKWPECKSTFKTRDEATEHWKFLHAEGLQFVCTVCNVTFKTKKGLKAHAKFHDDVIPQNFPCSFCDENYSDGVRLRKHVKATHPDILC